MYNSWLYSNSDWNRRLRKVYKKKIPFLLWCIMLIHMPNLFLFFSLPIADPLPLSTPLFSSAFALLCSLFCVFYSFLIMKDFFLFYPSLFFYFCFVTLFILCVFYSFLIMKERKSRMYSSKCGHFRSVNTPLCISSRGQCQCFSHIRCLGKANIDSDCRG
jgi:hypothetical protein